jgi:NAD-dependent SIR2 family protein deacetylase
LCDGPIKPDIVFFGEGLPKKFEWGWIRISNPPYLFDSKKPIPEDEGCDLMIVIGT